MDPIDQPQNVKLGRRGVFGWAAVAIAAVQFGGAGAQWPAQGYPI